MPAKCNAFGNRFYRPNSLDGADRNGLVDYINEYNRNLKNSDFAERLKYYLCRAQIIKGRPCICRRGLCWLFVLAIVLSDASSSFAAIYKFIDNNGIICFSNDFQSIPEQCRATAKIVSGDQE
jgi:hypothetical protein